MITTLPLQPATDAVRFDPAAESGLVRRAATRRPVRKLSLALALVVGVAVGGLISLDAASGAQTDVIGIDVKTEVVGG